MMKGGETEIFMTVKRRAESKKEVTYMKSLSVKLAVILLVMGLTICYAKAWAAEWKEFTEATTGVFHYDAASISYPSEGFLRVWIHNVTKNETNLVEINCKDKSYHILDVIQYDEADRVKSRETYYDNPTHNWYNISPGSVPEPLYIFLCP
jgi:hypothetical protein